MADKELNAGFTGDPKNKSATAKARQAAEYVKDEARAVATSIQDHPTTAGTGLLLFGAVAFLLGYAIGSSSPATRGRHQYW
ncbi:MAG: hypothetical protein QHC90_01530 [Shinella sp.]|nr:hypothetical protein [Shinella sp.]